MEKLSVIKEFYQIQKKFDPKKIIEFGNINNYSNFYIFELLINNRCDFKCGYCYMRKLPIWGQTTIIKNFEIIIKLIKKINKIYPTEICLSGGEALLHSKIYDFFEILKQLEWFNVHINTNLGRSFKKLKKIIDKNEFNLILHISFHPSEVKNINEFIDKIKYLENKKIFFELNYMFDKNYSNSYHINNIINLRKFIKKGKLYCKFIYENGQFIKPKIKDIDLEKISKYTDKEYYAIIDNEKFLLNDADIFKWIPFNFKGYNCRYTFFTINVNDFKIKEMCPNFNLSTIINDYKFFLTWPKKLKKFKCPHKECLWPSALDLQKNKGLK